MPGADMRRSCPADVCAPPCPCITLQPLLGAASVAVRLRERDAVRCALAFTSLAASGPHTPMRDPALVAQWQVHAEAATSMVAKHSGVLVASLVAGISETCPRQLVRSAGQALHALATAAEVRGEFTQFAAGLQESLARGGAATASRLRPRRPRRPRPGRAASGLAAGRLSLTLTPL